MAKAIKAIFLTALIAVAIFLVATVALLRYEPQNNVTLSIRSSMVRHPLLRTLFGLHDVGDAATDYLSPKTTSIALNIYTMPSQGIDDECHRRACECHSVCNGQAGFNEHNRRGRSA